MEFTLYEKICQSLIIKANPEKHIKIFGSIENFMKEYPIGGLFVGGEICPYSEDKKARESIITQYAKYSKTPLLVCMDGEEGVYSSVEGATHLPPLLSVGAADDPELAYRYSSVIASEIAGIGVNWTFAPVTDLAVNPQSLIMGNRVLGDDADKAAPLLKEVIRGYHDNGLLCTAKHFPGDGVDFRNQHIVKSENTLSKEEWYRTYGKMFKTAIDEGIDAVMVGHISAPAFQNDSVDGAYPPGTLSSDIVTKLLKHELGFGGVVVSDAMDMGGFLRWIYEQDEAEIKCFEAGVDMLLWPQLRVAKHIEERVKNGEIPMSRVEDAFDRIMRLKKKIRTTELRRNSFEYGRETAQLLAERGSCLLRNAHIPLDPEKYKRVRIVGIATESELEKKTLEIIREEFAKRGAEVEVYTEWCNWGADHSTLDRNYDLILYVFMLPTDIPSPWGLPAVTIHTSMSFDLDKTVVVSLTSQHILKQYCECAKTYINTYINEISVRNLVRGLYGETQFTGKPPVKSF